MKNLSSKIIVFLACIFAITNCYSQSINLSVLNSTGGYAQNGYYQFEWNVGEMALVDEMHTSYNLIVTNGFLQPYILNPGSANSSFEFGKDEIKVFPNPASAYVEINFFTKQKGRIKIEMLNGLGQKIYGSEMNIYGVDLIHRIPVTNLTGGVYLMNITLEPDAGYLPKHGVYKIVKI